MDETISGSGKAYQQIDNHGYRRSLYDTGDWSLVGIGVLVIVVEIIWTIVMVALVFGVLHLLRIWRGSPNWLWTQNTDSQDSPAHSIDLMETSVELRSIAQSRASIPQDDGDLPLPGLQNEILCPGERCPSFGPRTAKKVSFSNVLVRPHDLELGGYNFDNVSWFARHLDYHSRPAPAGDDFGGLLQVRIAV